MGRIDRLKDRVNEAVGRRRPPPEQPSLPQGLGPDATPSEIAKARQIEEYYAANPGATTHRHLYDVHFQPIRDLAARRMFPKDASAAYRPDFELQAAGPLPGTLRSRYEEVTPSLEEANHRVRHEAEVLGHWADPEAKLANDQSKALTAYQKVEAEVVAYQELVRSVGFATALQQFAAASRSSDTAQGTGPLPGGAPAVNRVAVLQSPGADNPPSARSHQDGRPSTTDDGLVRRVGRPSRRKAM